MEIQHTYPCLRINAPHLREHSAFTAWLNKAAIGESNGPLAATWHRTGTPDDYSDLFAWKDAGKEGSDSDMPEDVWNQLCELAGEPFQGVLWISFLDQ